MSKEIEKNIKKNKSHKIVIIGDTNVGKTSILDMFIENKFGNTKPSIGALHKLKSIKVDDEEVQLDIWDTAGQERFKSIVPMYYKGAKGIIIVYDITNQDSFEGAKNWIKEIESNNKSAILVLVGNKIDLEEEKRVVSKDSSQSFCSSKSIIFVECSAKDNNNVNKIFEEIAYKLPKSSESVSKSSDKKITLNDDVNTNKGYLGGCCG